MSRSSIFRLMDYISRLAQDPSVYITASIQRRHRRHQAVGAHRFRPLDARRRAGVHGEQGLILRVGDKEDKWIKLLYLSPKGEVVFYEAEPLAHRAQEWILARYA